MAAVGRVVKWMLAVLAITAAMLATGLVQPVPGGAARPLPVAAAEPTALDLIGLRINEYVASLTLEQQLAALMVVHCASLDPATVNACFTASGASGVILMGDNIGPDPAAVAALTGALARPGGFAPIVAIDEEGGVVTRLPWDTLPGGDALANAPVADTTAAFTARAGLLAQVGVNVNFGVVADVTDNPNSFLYDRVLGHTADASAERVAVAVSAESAAAPGALASTLKHFPGHGTASGNSHQVIPVDPSTLDAWRGSAALPFAAGIRAGAGLVMMSHVSVPAVDPAPASLSATWHHLLRTELSFNGVIVSDDLLMLRANGQPEFADATSNALRALQAGSDLLLWVLPADPASVGVDLNTMSQSLAQAVRDGRLDQARVTESLTRVLRLRASFVSN